MQNCKQNRLLKNIAFTKLENEYSKIYWECVTNTTNVEEAYKSFTEKLNDVIDRAAPYVQSKPRIFQTKNWWYANELMLMNSKFKKKTLFIKHKQFPFSPNLELAYQTQRNYVRTFFKETKTAYFKKHKRFK